MEKRKTQEEKQNKNIAETGIIYYLPFRAFGWESLGNAKKRDKTYCAETRDYSELMPTSSPDLNQDLQIFSLTLSQLSYLGNWRLLRESIIPLLYTIYIYYLLFIALICIGEKQVWILSQ